MAKEYHFHYDSVTSTEITPRSCDFVPLTKRESIGEKRDRRQKENAQDAEKFLETMQERVPRAKFTFGAGESFNSWLR